MTSLEEGVRIEINGRPGEWVETVAHAEDCPHWEDKPCDCEPVRVVARLDGEFKPLSDPITRMSAEACVIEALRGVGGEDYEGWRMVLENLLHNLRCACPKPAAQRPTVDGIAGRVCVYPGMIQSSFASTVSHSSSARPITSADNSSTTSRR